jgi:hypothetical protein
MANVSHDHAQIVMTHCDDLVENTLIDPKLASSTMSLGDRLQIPNHIGRCTDRRVVSRLPPYKKLSRMGQSVALHSLMLDLP